MKPNQVKRALKSGTVQIGTWVTTFRTPQLPQILASAGVYFLFFYIE